MWNQKYDSINQNNSDKNLRVVDCNKNYASSHLALQRKLIMQGYQWNCTALIVLCMPFHLILWNIKFMSEPLYKHLTGGKP